MAAELYDDDSRAPAWVIAAVVLHGLVFTLVMIFIKPHAREIVEIEAIQIDVEHDTSAPVEEQRVVEREPDPAVPQETTRPVAMVPGAVAAAGFAAPGPSASVLAMNEPAPTNEGAMPNGNGGVTAVPLTPQQLGLGGIGANNPFLPKKEEIPPQATNEKRREKMRGTGMERDMSLGLGPEGPALTALNDSTRTSIAPLRGRALFLVRSDGEGVVSAVEVLDSAGDSGWLDAAKQAFIALKNKRFRVPTGAKGLSMQIEVRSDMQLPNGEHAPLGIGERSGANGAPEFTLPDISNAGQSPRRVVKSHAVSIELL